MPVHIAPACSCPFASSVRTALLLLLPFIPAAAIATRGLPLLTMGRCPGRGALTIDGGQELLPQGARCEKPRIWPKLCSILSVARYPSDSQLANAPLACSNTPKRPMCGLKYEHLEQSSRCSTVVAPPLACRNTPFCGQSWPWGVAAR